MLADLFFVLIRHRETDPQCALVRFHSFLFSRNERREVYGGGIFAKNDGDDVRRQTSACGGMVANGWKGCIQSDSIHTDKITPKPPQKNEQNIR